jgi:hypothetical protein
MAVMKTHLPHFNVFPFRGSSVLIFSQGIGPFTKATGWVFPGSRFARIAISLASARPIANLLDGQCSCRYPKESMFTNRQV